MTRTTPPRGASLEELRAEANHAAQRLALYRRKVLLGQGEPRRLAELERTSVGAAARLERAGRDTMPADARNRATPGATQGRETP
jgi:hypothetical protein